MSLFDIELDALDGTPDVLGPLAGNAVLVVNVASRCGLTPQYGALQALHERYAERGFSVVGVPCNQFRGQEPGTAEEIAEFCDVNYGVTFPLAAKVDVNGEDRHPLYAELTSSAEPTGDVEWNFEKFLVGPDGSVVARFKPPVAPDDPSVVAAIEAVLPAGAPAS